MKEKILKIIDVPAFRVASGFVSSDPTRFGINGIHITKDGEVVATDGHILFASPNCTEPLEEPITIVLSKAIPKNAYMVEIDLERRALFVYLKNLSKSGQLIEFAEAPFPDYESIIPKDGDRGQAEVFPMSAKLLSKITRAIGNGSISFYPGKETLKPIEIKFGDYLKAVGVIMPMRI